MITHGTAPPHPTVHQILDRMFDGRSSITLGSYDADFTKGWGQLKGELDDWLHGSAHWDTAGRQRRTVVRIAGAIALVIGLVIGGFAVAAGARSGLGPAPLIAAGAAIAGAALGAIISSYELLVRTETGSALWLRANPSVDSSKTPRPVTWRRQPKRASCVTTRPGLSPSAKPAPGPVPSKQRLMATRRCGRRSAETWRSFTSDRRSRAQRNPPRPRRRVRTAAASPADQAGAAEAAAAVRGSGGHRHRPVGAVRRVATVAHLPRCARITPVKIDMLSNCAPVLQADPYALDNDALAESIEASQAAGFDAVGLWGFHVMFGGDDAAQVVADSGMPVQTIDAALGWVAGASDEAAAEIDGLIALADQLGADVIHATTLNPEVDLAAAAEGYAQIAARAEAADKVLGLEFLPWTGIPTLAVANQLCENAGPAAGILLDTWHWVRQPGGPDLELLRSLPAHRITSVQLSDVAVSTELEPEPEAMTARLLPGDGVVDYAELWEALDHIGATPVVAAEVMAQRWWQRAPRRWRRRSTTPAGRCSPSEPRTRRCRSCRPACRGRFPRTPCAE